jgi:hypothetical protein
MPPGETGYSFANVTTVAATRAARPTIVAQARFSTNAATNIGTTAPPGQTDGEVLDVEARSGDWLVTTVDDRYDIPRGNEPAATARWYVLDHGVLYVDHARGQVLIAKFEHGAPAATWTEALAEREAKDARVVGWLSDAVLVAVTRASDTQLVSVALAGGKERALATFPATEVVVAPAEHAGSFAAVFNEQPECALCPRVEVRNLADGQLAHGFKLPVDVDPFPLDPARGNATVGFDGRQVWFFTYSASHHSDVTGASAKERCSYDVFDVATGAKQRSLANAADEWASLTRGCRTHALLPTSNGGAIAIAVDDGTRATAAKFASPP